MIVLQITHTKNFMNTLLRGSDFDEFLLEEEVIKAGNILPMQDRQGHRMNGIVKEVKAIENKVTMDFNHPLAGEKLHFTGKVEAVRDATQKELDEGLYGEKVQHNCSDENCSSCGGGCSHCH